MDSWCHLILSSSLKKNALGESNKYCLLLVISHSKTRVNRRYVSSKVSILTTLTRDIESESLLRMRPSVIRCTMYPDTDLRKLPLLSLGNRNSETDGPRMT